MAASPSTGGSLVEGAPSRLRMFVRGLTRRCPVCGSGRIFRHYFALLPRCPRCGLRFTRLEGHWSGDIGINTIVTFSLLWLVMLGGTLVMWGDLNVAALVGAAAVVTFVFPVLFIPFAKTLWTAIDLAMRPLEAGELDPAYRDALARRTSGAPGTPA